MVDPVQIEQRVERAKAASVEIGVTIGNIHFATPQDIDQMAIRMSRGGPMVPPHCRGETGVGVCHALIVQALEWRMPILAVMNKSYVVKNFGTERIAYESQMIHAVIERNAPLKGRLRFDILGEGDERRCKVYGTFIGEAQSHDYTSETLQKLRDARGRNEAGQVKGSPLWDAQPEVQLFYSASRQWARLYCPDVILGAYTPEDPQYEMRDVTPPDRAAEYTQKLRDAKLARVKGERGFDAQRVMREARDQIIEGEINKEGKNETTKGSGSESVLASGRADVVGREGGDQDAVGLASAGNDDPISGPQPARHGAEGKQTQGDLIPPDGEAEKPKGKRK